MFGISSGKQRSVLQHDFSMVPSIKLQRSAFNRSHGHKTTFDAGYLVPVLVDEVLPGDTFSVNMSCFARLATPVKPVMDNLYLDTFFFYVPFRLVWSNWKKFMGEQANPGDSISYVVPQMVSTAVTGYSIGSLHDYFGIPTGIPGLSHSSLYHRAYNLIWNEWFRDQNLQNSVTVDLGDGPDTVSNDVLLRRGKRHDYFTSCLTAPQKGTAVTLPLGTEAGVYRKASSGVWTARIAGTNSGASAATMTINGATSELRGISGTEQLSLDPPASPNYGLYADLTNATASTINSLRQAFQLQKFLERDARGGTRYTEIVRSHFGVISPDARLQRPEFLGGGSTPINVSPIPQTSATAGGSTPQGNLAAMGTASAVGHGFTKSFTEHGMIIGLVSVRADLSYQQGLNRMWSRSTRYDFYWPEFSHLGEQTVLNKEIYAVGTGGSTDGNVFGYQERHAEYRYYPSKITGLFRSTAAGTLDLWHLAEKYTSLPVLNSTFIVSDPPIDRVIVTPTEPHFLFDSVINMQCARPMPMYSVPGLIDHF